MKKILRSLLLAALGVGMTTVFSSPIGYWKTIDDVTGEPKAIIQINNTPQHTVYGRIIKIYPRPGYDQNELCTACEGVRHNQPIVGMIVLQGLKQSRDHQNEWQGGDILDPKNGKLYHCYIRLAEDNSKLHVRGYIGLPLFGRSQTWIRVSGQQ